MIASPVKQENKKMSLTSALTTGYLNLLIVEIPGNKSLPEAG
jgi:hypothetical protein